ncbi:MAG: hypothetical protein MN733_31405, partial [Nitrososphaera sp.]|nr:hypothetical protein [Nitrososphaera sp.]
MVLEGPFLTFDMPQGPARPGDPPQAPVNLRVLYSLWPAVKIVQDITSLGDDFLIKSARSASKEFSHSIYKWEVLRFRLIRQNCQKLTGSQEELREQPDTITEASLMCLTLEDLNRLAAEELPDMGNFETLGGRVASLHMNLPWLALDLRPSSILIPLEFAIFICVAYFYLFQIEARGSPKYPAPGTLFRVLSRNAISRVLYRSLATLPPIAAGLLSMNAFSDTYVLWPLS